MAVQEGATRPRKERKENADKRRGQIIEATYRSIVRNGLSGTTLASVSNEAGLSQGVAVFYFQNKQSLLGAALRHQYEIYQEGWQKAMSDAGSDPADQITALQQRHQLARAITTNMINKNFTPVTVTVRHRHTRTRTRICVCLCLLAININININVNVDVSLSGNE